MKKIRFLILALVGLLGGVVSASGTTVYVDPVGNGTWLGDNAKISLNVYTDGQSNNAWVTEREELSDGVIKFTFDDTYNRMIIVRGENQDAWGWNQTENITPAAGKLYKANGYTSDSKLAYTVEDYTEPVAAGYVCDFNTQITTSDHAFQVASNWRHIVDSYENYYGGTSYPSYTWSETAGVGGSGTLSCGTNQSSNSIYDLLVTPVVKGTVTIQAKASVTYYSPQLEFYKITDNGDGTFTRGEKITVDVSTVTANDFVTITIPVDAAGERIGIRSSYVYLDNFTATEATIVPEKKIVFASAVSADGNNGTTGTIKWEEQANGQVLVSYTVKVTNTGDVDLTQGEEGFSISIINGSTGEVYGTTPVPQNLAKGETSDEFVVSAEVSKSLWPNSYTYVNMNLKENLFGSVMERAQSTYTAYESKFVIREAGSSSTSSLSETQNWGTINVGETVSKSYEICNLGTAPMTLYVEGSEFPLDVFALQGGKTGLLAQMQAMDNVTVDLINKTVTFDGGAVVPFTIVLNTENPGSFTGEVKAVYSEYGAEQTTFTLGFSATVIGANTWTADFNGDGTKSSITYPDGSIAENGISSDYNYSNGKYDVYPIGRSQSTYATENNKFITPKLHANAGDALTYDVKVGYSSSNQWYVKVYVSTDRINWGDPVAYYTTTATSESEAVGSAFTAKSLSFDTEGDYYVAFALYGQTSAVDNLVGLEKVDVAHDLYIKSVNWPDASIKSGTAQTKPSVEFIPLTTEMASAYTVKYVCGETVLGEGTPEALTASATNSKTIAINWTPQVEETTVYEGTKVVIEFTDGTKFETETFDLTVTNEAVFHFLNTKPSSKWYEPTDRTNPITFGKTNAADTQNFVIFNWGSAPLTVNSISLPAGFTTSVEFPLTVAAFNGENDGIDAASQALDITFSATEPGDYSGDMVITYSGDKTFTLPISGTKLDPNKFYATFGTSSDASNYPAGSLAQANVSITTPTTENGALTSSSSTKNLFITPLLTGETGEKFEFDSKARSTWYNGTLKIYLIEDHIAAANTTTNDEFSALNPTLVGEFTIESTVTDFTTYSVAMPKAGNYYLAFQFEDVQIDNLYGLTVTEIDHEWMIASSNIPTEAMQNVASTASVNILNLGLKDEAAADITVTAYVDGEAVATGEGVAIPMNHKLNDEGTKLSVNIIYPKVGTFPVYLEVKAGDYSVQTEPVDVTFAEEVAMADAIEVGSGTTTSYSYAPIDFYNFEQARTSDILYTKAQLTQFGLKKGDKITTLAFKGTASSAKTISNSSLKAWVALSSGDITYGSPDKTAMTEIAVYNAGEMVFTSGVNVININLPEAITYDGTSDLRIYLEGGGNSEWVTLNFAYDTNYSNMKWSNATSMKYNPLLYVTLEAQSATLAGNVRTSAGVGIANATVTLKAENGVEYSAKSDAEGNYSMNVIQAGLDFTATVEAEGFLKREFAENLGGVSKTLDVTMYTQYGIVGSIPGLSWDEDAVMTQDEENPMVFTLVKDATVEAGVEYEYKLRADGAWGLAYKYQLPAGDDNYKYTFEKAGTYTLTFTADVAEHTLVMESALKAFTLTEDACEDGKNLFEMTDEIANLTVERTFNAGWNAVVLPFALTQEEVTTTFGEGSKVAYFNGDTEDANGNVTVKFDELTGDLDANVPYMIYVATATTNPTFNNKTFVDPNFAELKAEVSGTAFDFMGTYVKLDVNAGDMFVSGGKFKTATTNNKVRAFRAYLKSKTEGARQVNIFVDGEEISIATPTAIDGIDVDNIDGNVYNINGQRVNKNVKHGVYIINGKKVVRK